MSVFVSPPKLSKLCGHNSIVGEPDENAASSLGYCIFENHYKAELIDEIRRGAEALEGEASSKFLSLTHLRKAHKRIPAIEVLMHDSQRLAFLSDVAGCELEPYPITTAAAHINYYRREKSTIDFHTDGCAFVELIPLTITGDPPDSATLIYNGSIQRGLNAARRAKLFNSDDVERIVQQVGMSVLLQGRRVLHSADVRNDSERVTLVLPLRSKNEPWKDDNTLFRLLQDDAPEDVVDEWVKDVAERQYPAFRRMQASQTP